MEEIVPARNVTNRQLGQLLGFIPVMIHWLRDVGPDSGSLLVKDSTSGDSQSVQTLLHRMLDASNFAGDLTIIQIRELGESSGDKVWAGAIRKIILDAEPALIPASVGVELLRVTGDVSKTKEALDRLTRTQYYALAELCSLFHDCGDADLAALVGSRLVVHSGHDSSGSSENSTNVMKQLISECDILFGRAAGATSGSSRALGGNSAARPSNMVLDKTELPTVSVQDALLKARKHALKAFFQWKDESSVECVDALFENYGFVDIARGVWERYDALPGGWRGELEELRDSGNPEAQWVPKDGKPLIPSSAGHASGSSMQDTAIPIAASKPARRTLVGFVRGSRTGMAEPPPTPQFSNLHLLINEIVDSEVFYFSVLKELQDNYVSVLREIASGSKGAEAQQALGISLHDVESVFGWRLAQVIETSKNLLARLEIINLVRNEPKHKGGRAYFVAAAFAAIAPTLSVNYAPFVSGHRHGMNVLNSRNVGGARPMSTRLDGRPMSNRLTTMSSRFSSKNLLTLAKEMAASTPSGNTFLSLWESINPQSKRLKGQSLQSIMIMPIQRIPRYKLLLAELEKKLPADHSALPMLSTALAQVSHVAQQINQALRQHEKLENLVGAADMPEIAGAKSTMKNGAMKLTVNYKASFSS